MTVYRCKKCGGAMEVIETDTRGDVAYVFRECSYCHREIDGIEEIEDI